MPNYFYNLIHLLVCFVTKNKDYVYHEQTLSSCRSWFSLEQNCWFQRVPQKINFYKRYNRMRNLHKLSRWYILWNRTLVGCWRQAFIQPTAELHQVWGRTEMPCLIWVLRGSMCMLSTCQDMHGGVGLV